jgi:hypothetical protein
VWQAVRQRFSTPALFSQVNQFRDQYIVHVEQPLCDAEEARRAMQT